MMFGRGYRGFAGCYNFGRGAFGGGWYMPLFMIVLTIGFSYNIIWESLCTAYKSTVQTEQAMNNNVHGAGLETATDWIFHICGTVKCFIGVFFYTYLEHILEICIAIELS